MSLTHDVEDLKTTQQTQISELRSEIEKAKADVRDLVLIVGTGGTQFDDAPTNATAI